MKKEFLIHLTRTIVFLIGFCLLSSLVGVVVKPRGAEQLISDDLMVDRAKKAAKEGDIDIIYLGDSLSISSIDPREVEEYGYSMYVCGAAGQELIQTENVSLSVNASVKEDILLIETNKFFEKYGFNDVLDNKINEFSFFIKYHDRWKEIISGQTANERKGIDASSIDYRGYKINALVQPADSEKAAHYMDDIGETKTIGYANRQMIKTIVNDCRLRGIKVMFISAPSVKNWSMAKHNGVQELADQLDVEYLDCNLIEEIGIDWQTDTRDVGDHLNDAGAKKMTKYTIEHLEKKGWLDEK